jgi:polyisoprenoid-binding protein YceI
MFTIKKTFATLALGLATLLPAGSEEYTVDTSHSALNFSIQHMGLGNTWGRFNDFSGTIQFDENQLAASAVSITANIASVDTYNKKRDDHLRNTDIFDAGTYPTMSFSGKGFTKIAEGQYEVTGDLTIRDTTKKITVVLKKIGEGTHFFEKKPAIGFEADFEIDRKDFGVGQGKVDGAMGKKVRIIAALEAIAK